MRLVKKPSPLNFGDEAPDSKPVSRKEKRMRDALKLAEATYDLYKKRNSDDKITPE